MTLVLLRHIVKNNKIKLSELHSEFANELVNNKGYSAKTRSILQEIKNENFFIGRGKSDHNGSIMRIAPLGLKNYDSDDKLINDITSAIYYTHSASDYSLSCCYFHCKLINKLINTSEILKIEDILYYILELSKCFQPLFTRVNFVKYLYLSSKEKDINLNYELFGNENFFQIKAIDCLSCSLYIFLKFYNEPLKGVCYAANLGGDTDTIGKIVGDLMGALHGTKWIPESWRNIENELEMIQLCKKIKN